MTGTLTVRYRVPTPLHVELRMIGEVDRVEGRKVFATGRMYAGDRLTAEADAVFVTIDPSQFDDLARTRPEPA
jgi:acyl-CoA thioesterase FadM